MYIVSAALRKGSSVVCGVRHGDCFKRAIAILKWEKPYSEIEQGFCDEHGVFYSREEALRIVKENGQLPGDIIGGALTSEDLW